MAVLVARDQLGEMEIVARVHAHAAGQSPAHGDLVFAAEQRDFYAVDLFGIVGQHGEADVHRRF